MSRFIALDPGKQDVYGAVFVDAHCICLCRFSAKEEVYDRSSFTLAVCEKPSILGAPNAADMAEVLWNGALVASALSPKVIGYSVPTWKGIIKKPIHHHRVWSLMTPAERMLFPENAEEYIRKAREWLARTGKVTGYDAEWTNHFDAHALGMFHVGRIKRGGARGDVHV